MVQFPPKTNRMEVASMATILASLPLHTEAERIYRTSAPEDQQKISETVSSVIVNFPVMGSNRLPNSALYEQDFFTWTQTTATLLRAGKLQEIDFHTLAEEIESMGKNDRRELGSQLQRLTMHLLKWHYQPSERSGSWRRSIRNARTEIQVVLDDSPSLWPQVSTLLAKRYPKARADALDETGLSDTVLPQDCPWTVEQILDDDFWPDAVSSL
jgi:hypothetical protein